MFVHCQYGAAYRKRTRLLVFNGPAFKLRVCTGHGICSRTGLPHEQLTRLDANGQWSTSKAQVYPLGVCRALAEQAVAFLAAKQHPPGQGTS